MEIQCTGQTTFNSVLPKVKKQVKKSLQEAFQEACSHKGQVMKVYDCKLVKEKKNAYSLEVKKYEYFNIKYKDCLGSFKDKIKKYFPKLKDEKIHTEIQWILENKNKIRSDRLYIIYSYYIPCTGNKNKNKNVSCAEELVKFMNDYKINIIVVYSDVHIDTNKNRSLEILKGRNIKTMCLNDINIIPTISSEIEYEIYRLCKKKLL